MTESPPVFDLTPQVLEALGIPHAMDPHPSWETPEPELLPLICTSMAEVREYLRPRHEHIARQLHDPLRYGWESAGFARCRAELKRMRERVPRGVLQLLIQGGNRPGKSEFCAKFVMETLVGRKDRSAWCFQQSEKISRETQQKYMKRYLPPEWRPAGESKGLKRGGITNVRYTAVGGFSNNTCSLPNGSSFDFKFYESDKNTLQGSAQDVVWFDELAPPDWVDDCRFRLVDRNGIMLVSFTAIDGYTDTVAMFLDGAVVVEEMEAELLPMRGPDGGIIGYEEVPLLMSCREPHKSVVYMPTQENPVYGSYDVMAQTLATAPREEILCRAYGVAVKAHGVVFTNFDDTVHVLQEAGLQRILEQAHLMTWDHIYDPAGARNPFMQWWAVTPLGQRILVREWPQPGDYIPGVGAEKGVWAVSGQQSAEGGKEGGRDGARGPAQKPFGFGPADMSREIRRVERELAAHIVMEDGREAPKRIPIHRRMMDSRAASAPNATSEGSITLVEIFADLGEDPLEPGEQLALDFDKASGRQSSADGDNWQAVIQMELAVPKEDDPRRAGFIPPVMVAHCCRNTIFSLKTWTGLDGQRGACRDPIDCWKYEALSEPEYVAPVPPRRSGRTWGGY